MFVNMGIKKIEKMKVYVPSEVLSTSFFIKISEDEDRRMMKIPLKILQNLGYEFHIYQKHEMEICEFLNFEILELSHIAT